MALKLYYEDAYIKEFEAEVLSCKKGEKGFEIILDKTAFFPEGGGQPGDRGYIGDAEVKDTVEKDGEVVHICSGEAGGKVNCRLNWDFRFSNMQQHSGEHIFSGITHRKTGLDNVGFHMGQREVTVDFNGYISPETLDEIEDETNRVICENRKINILLPSPGELEKYDYRSKKEIEGQVRLVEIEGADLCACCGTHVKLTGETGPVKLINAENYKQGVRLTLKIGRFALEDYREKNRSVAGISAALCAKTDEVLPAVEKLKEKLNETRIELNNTKIRLIETRCESAGADFPAVIDGDGDSDSARIAADMLAEKFGTGFGFSGNDKDGYKYAVASRSGKAREIGAAINAALNGRGGGKPEMVMGSLKASKEEIEKTVKNILQNGQ